MPRTVRGNLAAEPKDVNDIRLQNKRITSDGIEQTFEWTRHEDSGEVRVVDMFQQAFHRRMLSVRAFL